MRSVKVAGLVAVLACGVTALGGAPDSESAKMRAVVIHGYGGPEVMKLENVARPEPVDAVVLIRVVAASINPVDVATMHYGAFPGSLSEADIRVVAGNDARVKFMKPGATRKF